MNKNNIIAEILKTKLQLTEKISSMMSSDEIIKKSALYEIAKNSLYLTQSHDKNYLLCCGMNELNHLKESYIELNSCFQEIVEKEK